MRCFGRSSFLILSTASAALFQMPLYCRTVTQTTRTTASSSSGGGGGGRGKSSRSKASAKPAKGKRSTTPPRSAASAAGNSNNSNNKSNANKKKAGVASSVTAGASTTSSSASAASVSEVDRERMMNEDDVRLSVRMLLSRHFSRAYSMRLPEEHKLEQERRQLELKLADRARRIEQKTRNAMELLGPESNALGDGILPLSSSSSSAAAAVARERADAAKASAGGKRGSKSEAAPLWMMVNPVAAAGADGSGVEDADSTLTFSRQGVGTTSIHSLCAPDLSVYDNDRDVRIPSADTVREAAQLGVTFDDGDEELLHGASSTAAAGGGTDMLLRQQLAAEEEEDADQSVSAYELDEDHL